MITRGQLINERYEIRVVVIEIQNGTTGDVYDNFEEFKKILTAMFCLKGKGDREYGTEKEACTGSKTGTGGNPGGGGRDETYAWKRNNRESISDNSAAGECSNNRGKRN